MLHLMTMYLVLDIFCRFDKMAIVSIVFEQASYTVSLVLKIGFLLANCFDSLFFVLKTGSFLADCFDYF